MLNWKRTSKGGRKIIWLLISFFMGEQVFKMTGYLLSFTTLALWKLFIPSNLQLYFYRFKTKKKVLFCIITSDLVLRYNMHLGNFLKPSNLISDEKHISKSADFRFISYICLTFLVLPTINFRYKRKSIKELYKMLHNCNEQLQQFSHVNKKALDQYVNFTEQREELQKRQAELDAGDEVPCDL